MRWGVSLVLRGRLPAPLQQALADARLLIGESHTFYNQANWHITVRSLEAFREEIPADDQAVAQYCELLSNLKTPDNLRVQFKGLVSTHSGLLACGYPLFDLFELRQTLFDKLEKQGLVESSPEPDREQLRNSCHASLILYGGKLRSLDTYIPFLEAYLEQDLGRVSHLQLDLVRYFRSNNGVVLTSLL